MPLLRSFWRSFCAHAGQQAEVVLLDRHLPAAGLELALGAVPVQDEVGRRRAGEQRGHLLDALSHFASQGRGLHLECGVVVAVNDFAEADLASEHLRSSTSASNASSRPVVLGELVAEDETDGNELGRLAPACGRHALDGMNLGLKDARIHLCLHSHVGRQTPLGSFQVLRRW